MTSWNLCQSSPGSMRSMKLRPFKVCPAPCISIPASLSTFRLMWKSSPKSTTASHINPNNPEAPALWHASDLALISRRTLSSNKELALHNMASFKTRTSNSTSTMSCKDTPRAGFQVAIADKTATRVKNKFVTRRTRKSRQTKPATKAPKVDAMRCMRMLASKSPTIGVTPIARSATKIE